MRNKCSANHDDKKKIDLIYKALSMEPEGTQGPGTG